MSDISRGSLSESPAKPEGVLVSEATRERVKKLLSGDWTPYIKSQQTWKAYAATASDGTIVPPLNPNPSITEWDYGLLRHDIHVLFHSAHVPKISTGFASKVMQEAIARLEQEASPESADDR